MNRFSKIILSFLILLCTFSVQASITSDSTSVSTEKLVYKLDIKREIGPAAWRQTKDAFEEAENLNADLILIHMNTYGGMVIHADSIRTAILNQEKPVYVFIDNNAASAGALISIACDSIYMRPGANIGAATVVNQTGQAMPDKYQSYMRSTMRATAESHGKDTIVQAGDTIYQWKRDPLIAEAMVDPRTYIENVIDTGKVLTFTPDEAIKNGYCEGIANNVDEVLKKAGVKEYTIRAYEPSGIEKVVDFMINPVLQGILIMIIIGGIYFELQTPGIGFPILASAIAAVLYFSPLYLEGMAENWEIILFGVGVILLAVEIFVIPGFGVAGVSGIIFIITGLTLSLVDNVAFEFEPRHIKAIVASLLLVIFSMLVSIVGSIYMSKKLFTSSSLLGHLALSTVENAEEGYVGVDMSAKSMVGKTGIAMSVLRPSGKVIIDNQIYDAKSEDGFIDKETEVEVIRFETGQVYVIKKEDDE
ncbi:NfeD family protein [Marinifilum caeruleilacunae]|uniref:Nodulation protein NfeD n=1 Tax=Marinifilum caeruleilacunae TaxID=2499076 RepID=A0ABX1WU42_9BACT|nr:NfeD family protein [Marinifilum caeruleilacunae]NOU59476.1 nodulation protein NfeD [Marinifilum caeruleilacunae]